MPLLTEEEVQHYLGINSAEMHRLVKRGKLSGYRIGGTYLRFEKDEVVALKNGRRFVSPQELGRNRLDKIRDFWKFNSFYVFSVLLIFFLIALFLQL